MAYAWLFLMLNKCHNFYYKFWHFAIVLTNNISKLSALKPFLFQNNLLKNCYNTYQLAWNKWFYKYMRSFNNNIPLQDLPNFLVVFQFLLFLFFVIVL